MIEQGGRGGVADYTAELVRALVGEGWSVTLATADDHLYPPIEGVVVRPVFHYVRDGTPIGRIVRRRGLGKAVNGLLFGLALPRLMLLARSANTDMVHAQGWEIPRSGSWRSSACGWPAPPSCRPHMGPSSDRARPPAYADLRG